MGAFAVFIFQAKSLAKQFQIITHFLDSYFFCFKSGSQMSSQEGILN